MKILLTDNYNSYNGGDAAILEGMLAALRPALPEATFALTSSYPDVARQVHGLPALAWGVGQLASRRALASWLARSVAWSALASRGTAPGWLLTGWERDLMAAYRSADAVIGVGGAYLRAGYRLTWLRLWQMALAKRLGKPVMLYAESIGPFVPGSRLARWACHVLDQLDVITLRDEASVAELERLGVTRPYRERTADAALALPAPPHAPRRPDEPLRIGVSVLHWHKFARGSFEGYRAAVAGALDGVVDAWDARVTFLSTTVAPAGSQMDVSGTSRDDVAAARDVLAAMRRGDRATVSTAPLAVPDLHAAIAAQDLWLGTRMHSTIFATTAGVPTVAIAYEPKVAGYFELLGLGAYVLDIEDITAAALTERLALARRETGAIRRQLAERLPPLRKRARRNAELAAAMARGNLGSAPDGGSGRSTWVGGDTTSAAAGGSATSETRSRPGHAWREPQ